MSIQMKIKKKQLNQVNKENFKNEIKSSGNYLHIIFYMVIILILIFV